MAHSIAIEALVTQEDGTEWYYEAHRWPNIGDADFQWFEKALNEQLALCNSVKDNKQDNENLSVKLSGVVDGQPLPDFVATGVSYHAIVKVEDNWLKLFNELNRLAHKKADKKRRT